MLNASLAAIMQAQIAPEDEGNQSKADKLMLRFMEFQSKYNKQYGSKKKMIDKLEIFADNEDIIEGLN